MVRLIITHVVSIYQFERSGNSESYSTSPRYTNVNASISPTGTDIQTSGDVAAFQLFEVFLYDVTVKITNGDKLVTQDGSEYLVSGVPYVINNLYLQYIRVLARQIV